MVHEDQSTERSSEVGIINDKIISCGQRHFWGLCDASIPGKLQTSLTSHLYTQVLSIDLLRGDFTYSLEVT